MRLLFSRLNTPALSDLLCMTFVALCWTPVSPCLSGTGGPALDTVTWGRVRERCLSSAEQRGRVTSLNLLATLFLMQLEREWVYVTRESKQNNTELGFRDVVEHCWCSLLSGIWVPFQHK